MAIIKLNNELRELELKEQKEIEMILAALSTELVPYIEPITTDFEILTKLDFIFAKAALSRIYNCSMPKFNRKGYIHIKMAAIRSLTQKRSFRSISGWEEISTC